ncbi:Hcp family type VI secretion system effector [Siccibacter colletis]|uniref:Hcp family type VI secretion system effector n=1 Tax=Siccibacter colletis TaxID=1505757 RepID=UPI0028BEBB02|nr:Hcp family type VI secretion system effector [Siccibacter colletis]WNN50251.1 Hcp family type VI secretion system effector [Siccibacter colletis]
MANLIYLNITGDKQGLISSGCGTEKSIGNKWQKGHEDQIFIFEANNVVSAEDNISFHAYTLRKPIDKATPLMLQALNDKEKLDCILDFYRTSANGGNELYFKIHLNKARITEISYAYPNSMTHNDIQPQELVSLSFATITMEHIIANTSAWASWKEE